jgi:hypothetical protein
MLIHAVTWMNLEDVILSEKCQTQKPHIVCEMPKIGKSIEMEGRFMVTRT